MADVPVVFVVDLTPAAPFEVTLADDKTPFIVEVGERGLPGKAGTDDAAYIYEQNTPASTWVVAHNLGKFPSVTIVDSGNTVVDGGVQYDSNNQLTLTFSVSFSGKAYLN